ncbi:MAG: phosphate acyltransferase PlsX [Brevefilum sp.]|nr:phosphate acyltransferase PlsX [Brevefilum sp.]MDT8380780.1 phosphate acyltransferase PlsX [Brevefilum sp.]MDW7753633.1 phosphate acyltransferase PlsX [Brevefilum sp.]
MTIILDAMGSDDRPDPEVQGAVIAANELNEEIVLVGNKNELESLLKNVPGDKSRVHIAHAPEALDMSDHIVEARAKKQNSMKIGMELVKEGRGDAFVTAGNTGMAMYFAKKTFGDIEGVIRPCLCGVFPVRNGKAVVLDIGANAECRPEFLVQFSIMGKIYAQTMLKIAAPRVGLLSNGEEEGKGNNLVRETFPLLENVEQINFVGNVEGKELFGGDVDVVVTDGFTGNVVLKSTEAVAKLIVDILKEELMSSFRTKMGGLLAKPAFGKLRSMLDPSEVGAAPLLGIDALVFVGHGRSDTKAIVSAIREAKQAVDNHLLEELRIAITESLS